MIFFGWSARHPFFVPLAATLGALGAMLVLVGLVRQSGPAALELLVLGGVALGQVALTAFPLLELACALHCQMATFESAGVPDKECLE